MKKILIADDAEINRALLSVIFEEQFEILEAEDGEVAIKLIDAYKEDLSLILLDLVMPNKSGLEVLDYMNKKGIVEYVPVIMITGEASETSEVKAYEYGVADIIYKPFSRSVVTRRALNIIELYEQRTNMEKQLAERTVELQETLGKVSELNDKLTRDNDMLINALGSVLELRSLESGSHIRRVQNFSRIMLNAWVYLHPECGFSQEDIDQMVSAAALHDIGKIAIPDEILCKPGKLTNEEYDIMKTHTVKGCELLEHFKQEESEFYRYSYDICRYHHERFDGRGYPDGLKGNKIPVWAQVVSIVDVYDALISPRVYKAAFDVEEACRMIHNNECGVFSPDIMECFDTAMPELVTAIDANHR